MYPGAFIDTNPDKPAIIMGSTGDVTTFAELDAAANAPRRCCAPPACSRATTWRLHGEPSPLPRGGVGVPLRRGDLHRGIVAATSGELSYILTDSEAKVFITSKYKADQAAEIVDDTPGIAHRLMLDGTSMGTTRTKPPSRSIRPSRSTGASRVPTCSIRRARQGCQGCRSRVRPTAIGDGDHRHRRHVAATVRVR